MKLDLPVMACFLVAGAALQCICPALPLPVPLKLPLLVAVVAYYAVNRPPQMAVAAAFWAGILIDGTGGLSAGFSSIALALAAGFAFLCRKALFETQVFAPSATGLVSSFLLLLVQYASLGAGRPPFGAALLSIAIVSLCMIPVSVAFGFFANNVELMAGNVEPPKEVGVI